MQTYARIDMTKQKAAEAELEKFAIAVRNDTLGDFSITGALVAILCSLDFQMED